jgi:chemotaxis signal transduction protein
METVHNSQLLPSSALNRPLNRRDSVYANVFDEVVTRRLGFKIGNLGLLIAQQSVSELSDLLEVCPIPFTAAWLLGLINLRGNFVPVFDLYKVLQLPAKNDADLKQMLLILGQGESAGAIVIDGLPEHLSFVEQDELHSLPKLPQVIKPFATSGYEKGGQIWFNFDNEVFFESLAKKLRT